MNVKFSCGVEWDVKEVPPYATLRVQALIPEPEMPELPLVQKETGLGGSEMMPAPPDSPEYKAYLDAYRQWRKEKAQTDQKRERLSWEFSLLLAFEGLVVPEDWQPPALALAHVGLEPREGESGRLLDYVEYALLVTQNDIAQANRAMNGEAAPLTEQEVKAAEAFFPGDEEQERAAAAGA